MAGPAHPAQNSNRWRRVRFRYRQPAEIRGAGGGLRSIPFVAIGRRARSPSTAPVPVPPYIRRAPTPVDVERYQTVYQGRRSRRRAPPRAALHVGAARRYKKERGRRWRSWTCTWGRGRSSGVDDLRQAQNDSEAFAGRPRPPDHQRAALGRGGLGCRTTVCPPRSDRGASATAAWATERARPSFHSPAVFVPGWWTVW